MHKINITLIVTGIFASLTALGQSEFLNEKALKQRVTQDMVVNQMSLEEIRKAGELIFTIPFTKEDGLGDGPQNSGDRLEAGSRPTINGNGTFLRINGLDSQSCQECHSIISVDTIPPIYGIGGAGTVSTSAFPRVRNLDVTDEQNNGFASLSGGRMINPPFLFGAGGIELLAKEMTRDLQDIRRQAGRRVGVRYELLSKGISFGHITATSRGQFDMSEVEGINGELVVRPFGRKGSFPTIRAFDVEALPFHMGLQPTELEGVGEGNDEDGDGIVDEILTGEVSALHIHNVLLPTPRQEHNSVSRDGLRLFNQIGCNSCHTNSLRTDIRELPVSSPEVETAPFNNVYRRLDLSGLFESNRSGGLNIPLFSDLKIHNMGDAIAERAAILPTDSPNINEEFITARLWGVADTAPYMHDGRATSLDEAIRLHGGEARSVRDNYLRLDRNDRGRIIGFLKSLKTPRP